MGPSGAACLTQVPPVSAPCDNLTGITSVTGSSSGRWVELHNAIVRDDPETLESARHFLSLDPQGLRLLGLIEETGPYGTLVLMGYDWDDKPSWLHSMELFARELMPALNKAVCGSTAY